MKITVSNNIRIKGYDKSLIDYCDSNLVLDNPEYLTKKKLNKWIGKTPAKLCLYEKHGDELILPFGCLKYLWDTYKSKSEFEPLFKPKNRKDYMSRVNLYDYQEKAVQLSVRAKNGIIVAPCGAGKTQIGLELIARIGGRALWLTHKSDLLTQSLNRAKNIFDLPDSEYGTITAGKVTLGNTITFATVQTMANIDLVAVKNYFDVIVVDEAHHACGSPTKLMMFYKVVNSLSARYKYGLTASEERADGLHKSMFSLLGDKIVEIDKASVKNTTCPVMVSVKYSGYVPEDDKVLASDGTIIYSQIIADMIENRERNEFIVNEIRNLNGSVLVLSDRRKHLQDLYDMLHEEKSSIIKALTNTQKSRDEREKQLAELNNGEIRVLFATYQLAKEGLDIPNLRFVVFATPQKDKITVTQSVGRVGRKAKGKELGVVIDIVDDFGMLYGFFKKRRAIYKKLKYEIVQ